MKPGLVMLNAIHSTPELLVDVPYIVNCFQSKGNIHLGMIFLNKSQGEWCT